MKSLKIHFICLLLIFSFITTLSAQKNDFFLKPTGLLIDINGNGMLQFNKSLKGQWLDFLRVRSQLTFPNHFSLIVENKSSFPEVGGYSNRFSQYYVQYANFISHKKKFPLFRFPTYLTIKLGKIECYPTYRDNRLISENMDLFKNPYSLFGIAYYLKMPIIKDHSLYVYVSGYSPDFFDKEKKGRLENAYISYRKSIIENFGVAARVGIMQGSQHFVNYAYLYYKPMIENMQIGIKVGKLLSLDAVPYGIEISLERKFRFIAIGGYYQRRINQRSYFNEIGTHRQIFGFTFSIIAPKKLKKIFDAYQFVYDANTQTLRFVVPFLLSDIQFK